MTAGRTTAARRGVGQRASLGCSIFVAAAVVGRMRGSLVSAFEPAWRTQRGRPGVEEDDSTLLLKGTPLRPPMNSSSWSSRMVAASFPEVEAASDCRVSIWNVTNVRETNGSFWICVGMVRVILTVLSGVPSGISISDDCRQQKETDENAAWQRRMKRARTPCRISKILTTAWNPDGIGATCRRETCRRWWNWCALRAQELQVLLVRRQCGQFGLCENLAKYC